MTSDINFSHGIVALVSFVVLTVSQKDTFGSVKVKFMLLKGSEVGITGTPKGF